jgi:putative protease
MDDLEKLSNRGYTEGFYRRHVHDEYQNYEQGTSVAEKQQFVGEVIDVDREAGTITVEAKNRFGIGVKIELMTPKGNLQIEITELYSEKGEQREAAPGSGHVVKIPVDTEMLDGKSLLLKELSAPIHT